jgi:DNA-binding transcriptional ArsR family regulator
MQDLRRFKADFFKALAHPMRIAVVDSLRQGELGVTELSSRLKVEQSALSQQLAVLRHRRIVVGRKEGLNVYYSVPDPVVFKLLDIAKLIFNNQLTGVRDLLAQIKKETV